jgi:hypothetical protein
MVEGDGTSSGEVKFLDIRGNTDSEGSHLGQNLYLTLFIILFEKMFIDKFKYKTDAETRKRGERHGLDTRLVHAVNDEC